MPATKIPTLELAAEMLTATRASRITKLAIATVLEMTLTARLGIPALYGSCELAPSTRPTRYAATTCQATVFHSRCINTAVQASAMATTSP